MMVVRLYHFKLSSIVKIVHFTQALTNQILSDVRSRTPALQHLFVNVLPYQNICVLMKQKIPPRLCYKHSAFLVVLVCFLKFSPISL